MEPQELSPSDARYVTGDNRVERRLIRLVAGSAAGGGLAIALAALVAPSAYAYGPLQPSLFASISSAGLVTTAAVDITGAQPSESYTFAVAGDGQTVNLPSGVADSNGDFASSFDLSGVGSGTYEMEAFGSHGDVLSAPITVPASPSASSANSGTSSSSNGPSHASGAVTPTGGASGPAAGSGPGSATPTGGAPSGSGLPTGASAAPAPAVHTATGSAAQPSSSPVAPATQPATSVTGSASADGIATSTAQGSQASLFHQGVAPAVGASNIGVATHKLASTDSGTAPAFSNADIAATTAGGATLIAVGGLVVLGTRRRRAWS
jgi:hypothetical protein